jgi:glycosyltransferase involved in cell wall biosynthesis
MPRVKVLVVLASPPLPEGGAPGKHAIALLRGLAAHGAEVRAIAAHQYFDGQPPSDLAVELVAVEPAGGSLRERLQERHGPLASGAFARRVREAARDVDVLHLEQVDTSWIGARADTPSALHVHYRIRLDRRLGPLWRGDGRWALERALRERAAVRRHDHLVASSPLVAASLRAEVPRTDVVHAPLSLDPVFYPAGPLVEEPVAGIIGTADWEPTGQAMARLLGRVWPRVRERAPGVRLLVAGRGTSRLPGEAGVAVLGEVPSATEFLHRLTVLVFPLSRGSGMKVKVLEAMACGIPVVTTRAGAEGVDATDGLLVADDDAGLAEAASALLLDPAEARRRGDAARAAFLAHHAPLPATEPLIALYRRMIR